MNIFNYEKESDGIVTITVDMTDPAQNMNGEYQEVMSHIVTKLEAEAGLAGVIITSVGKSFFTSGKLEKLEKILPGGEEGVFHDAEEEKSVLRRLERLPVPVVAAIKGAALGEGFEICLACNHRIALDQSVTVGLPAVTFGLMPGTGGTVRLTRLLGLERAMPFLLDGKILSAVKAFEAGLVDEIVENSENLLPRAKAWIQENSTNALAAIQPWDQPERQIPGGGAERPEIIQATARASIRLYKKTRGLLPAPKRILETAVEALRLDFDTALRIESRALASLVTTPQMKNMINGFFVQLNQVNGGASRPKGIVPNKVKKVGLIGAGMMGQGIAYVSALSGIEVILKDVAIEAAIKGKSYSEKLLDKTVSLGGMTENEKKTVLDRIHPTADYEDLEGCDLIIEAVFEDMDLKKDIVGANENLLTTNGVWGSNTSTLPITQLAEGSSRPENFIGIHFFSPVDRMRLVEIICGEKTGDETLAKAYDFVQQIGKTPIVVKDSVGFFTSRVFGVPLQEGAAMVAEGISPVRIENLAKALGMPVGPLASFDEVSLRLVVEVNETQIDMGLFDPANDPTPEGTLLVRTLLKEYNRKGRQYGGGFYEYSPTGKTLWPMLIEHYYQPESDSKVSDLDIKDRLLFRAIIESLKCLEEGVLRSVADGNIGSLYGIGAPKWTGGYIQFVNGYGLENFINRCEELTLKYGTRFCAPDIVAQKVAAEELFV